MSSPTFRTAFNGLALEVGDLTRMMSSNEMMETVAEPQVTERSTENDFQEQHKVPGCACVRANKQSSAAIWETLQEHQVPEKYCVVSEEGSLRRLFKEPNVSQIPHGIIDNQSTWPNSCILFIDPGCLTIVLPLKSSPLRQGDL